jgi:NAD+ kinase
LNGDTGPAPQRIAITYNPGADGAEELAEALRADVAALGRDAWVVRDAEEAPQLEGADLVVTLGGDGTVLRTARLLTGTPACLLGVNLGRLGFLTEFDGHEARERLPEVLRGAGRVEERTMLAASVDASGAHYHALNEAVIGRATLSRAIQLAVDVDGVRIADYRSDGVIIATATGSTAYALSVGGPILAPESRDLVIVPVAPHLASQHAVVLPGSETVRVTLEPGQQAVLSLDGQVDIELREGDIVTVEMSEHKARFLRLKERSDFYVRMAAQLGWHRPGGNARPLPPAPPSAK